jgi:3-oxoadipate enol-lactonase
MELKTFSSGDPKNKSIIFIHGFPFDHLMWEKQVEFFKTEFYCVTYDIRGLGNSPAGDGQYTMESFVDDLENVINSFHLHKPILCGLSMGGYTALRAVERNQEKYKALILSDTKSSADNDDGKLGRAAGIKKINNGGVKKYVDDFIPNCFSKYSLKKIEKEYRNIILRSEKSSSTGLKGCLLAMAGRTDTTHFLEKIIIPTLVICGEDDKLIPPQSMKQLSNKIKNSEFKIVKEAGHLLPVENHEEFNRYLHDFFSYKLK